jgi:thiaminase
VREGLVRLDELSASYGGDARYPFLLREFLEAVKLETAFWNAGRSSLARSAAVCEP